MTWGKGSHLFIAVHWIPCLISPSSLGKYTPGCIPAFWNWTELTSETWKCSKPCFSYKTLRVIKPPERFSASVWWIAHESSRFSLLILPTHCFYLVRKEKRKEKKRKKKEEKKKKEEEKGKKKKKKTSVVLKQLYFSRMLLEHLSFVRENDKLMKEFHKSEVWCVRPVRCVPCFWISWMNVGCGFRFLAMATISRIMNAAPLVLVWGVRNTLTIVCVVSLPKGPPRQWWKPC